MKKITPIFLFCFLAFLVPVNAENTPDGIRPLMDGYIAQNALPGVVYIIADKEKILEIECLGYHDIANKRSMAPDVLFWIASQSKPVAGVAVMMLVEEGKLDLDESVTTYLPELDKVMVSRIKKDSIQVLEKPTRPVTLRHLLSHTSGMTFLGGVQAQTGKIDMLSLSNSVYVSAITPLSFEPGEGELYSNQGINLAAAIVERVSGLKYEAFLQKRLFDPLEMKSATFFPDKRQLSKFAIPYSMKKNGMEEIQIHHLQYPLDDRDKRYAEAGGGIFCTPEDLLKFYQMIASGGFYKGKRYLTAYSVKVLGEQQEMANGRKVNGLGWNANDLFMGHGGAYGTNTKIYKKEGLIVMYFVMGDLPEQKKIFGEFEKLVREKYNIK
ncbi:MAG: beta-lactamase family protein [Candidatus Azobacteroides sp.]|nr:beta-lactamase family protein [Candidatus Azobacteroides sp.]